MVNGNMKNPGNAEKWYLTNALMSNTIKQLDVSIMSMPTYN